MCGRYALGIRASFVRYQLQQQGLQVDDAPPDDQARETYNFPPGSYGLVYRAEIPDHGIDDETDRPVDNTESDQLSESQNEPPKDQEVDKIPKPKAYQYELKTMKWGLIPFWTKRSPDYGSMMRTINCRDDSLIENRGMWTSMKQKKRCIVIAQGFYEWLKKGPGGKDRIPHFVKRKDGNLMCFAGLWDCVKYEDTEEKLYTYTIITTNANKQLKFLHDRMPVILDAGSEAMRIWLDPDRNKWSKELQTLLKPFEGELECYQVNKEVGKVGNNSPDFIIPIDSKENKNNIANFFGNPKSGKAGLKGVKDEDGTSKKNSSSENNAPLPMPKDSGPQKGEKRTHEEETEDRKVKAARISSPPKSSPGKKPRSATSNEGSILKKSPAKKTTEVGSQRITNFFGK